MEVTSKTNNRKKQLHQYVKAGIIGLLANSLYVVIDGIFVARMLGESSLAAITTAVPILEVTLALSMMIAVGSGVFIAMELAKNQPVKAREYFNSGLMIMLGAGLLIMAFLLLFKSSIVRLLGATPDIFSEASAYYFWFVVFIPVFMLNYGLGIWVRNDLQPRLVMYSQVGGAIVNIALDYVFMGPLKMGVAGAAIATGLGPAFGLLLLVPHVLRRRGHLYLVKIRLRFSVLKSILQTGLPNFTIEFALGLMTLLFNVFVSDRLGSDGLSAFGAIGYINLIFLSIFLGAGEGSQPLISRYHGQKDYGSLDWTQRYLSRGALLIGLMVTIIIVILRNQLASIFIPLDNSTLMAMTTNGLMIYFLTYGAVGLNVVTSFTLQAKQSVGKSMVISLARSFVLLLPLLVVFSRFAPPQWLWGAYPLVEALTLPLTIYLWRRDQLDWKFEAQPTLKQKTLQADFSKVRS